MRNAFADEVTKAAQDDDNVVLLSGDIGNRLFDRFKETAPERFFNCGVAEANMMSVAAGMAMSGLRPIVYTITPFVTTRCLEQIKIDVCYQKAPVMIVGVGSGLGYASLGPTHHSCEDIAFLRALPNMTVVCPGDAMEVRSLLQAGLKHSGPVYMRLGKKNEPVVHDQPPDLKIGQATRLSTGQDVSVISSGTILPLAISVKDTLNAQGISVELIHMHTVKPLDTNCLQDAFSTRQLVVTLEEHSTIGGMGGAIAEWRADHVHLGAPLLRFGTRDEFLEVCANQLQAREHFGLSTETICARIIDQLQSTRAAPT